MLRHSIFVLVLSLPLSFAFAQDNAAAIASIQSALRSHQCDQALAITKSSLQKRPADFRVWTLQGIALSMKGDSPAALAAFRRALTLSPQYPAALKGEAQLLYQTGDQRAAPVLEQIVEMDPDDQTAQEMLGLMQGEADECSSAGQNNLAIEQCRLALQVDPANQSAYYHLIMASRETKPRSRIW